MKKVRRINNEGFSLVELIIVIAIMAILAAALAPQLIKYIDNSRKSTDVQSGQSIATAVGVALTDEAAYNAHLQMLLLQDMLIGFRIVLLVLLKLFKKSRRDNKRHTSNP